VGGHLEIIKYLQSKGCDVSVKDKVIDLLSGALHLASSGGHTEIIKYLQSKGLYVPH
jgi:ankyrin repeat protein